MDSPAGKFQIVKMWPVIEYKTDIAGDSSYLKLVSSYKQNSFTVSIKLKTGFNVGNFKLVGNDIFLFQDALVSKCKNVENGNLIINILPIFTQDTPLTQIQFRFWKPVLQWKVK